MKLIMLSLALMIQNSTKAVKHEKWQLKMPYNRQVQWQKGFGADLGGCL